MQRNKTKTVFQGRVPNAAAGRHLQLHTCPLHCQSIDHRQLCRGEIKSKIKKTTKIKIKAKKKSKSLHCQPIDHVQLSRGEITPTSDPLHDPHLTFPQKLPQNGEQPQDQCSNYSNNFFLSPLPSSKWDHLSSRRHCLYYVTHHNKKPKASLNVQTVQILHPGDPPMYNCLALHLCLAFFKMEPTFLKFSQNSDYFKHVTHHPSSGVK